MGFAAYVRRGDSEDDITDIAFASDLRKLWAPIISNEELDILGVCITGGLEITEEYHQETLRQTEILLREIEKIAQERPELSDKVRRCKILVDIVKNHHPGCGSTLYLG